MRHLSNLALSEGEVAFEHYSVFEHIVSSLSFSRLMSEVGHVLGIPALAPSDDDTCQLAFDGRHLLQIVYIGARDRILLSCPVGSSKITAEQALLAASSNFMQAAGGTVACATPDGRLVLQSCELSVTCPAPTLLSAIETLLNQVEKWEIELARARPSPHTLINPMSIQLA